MKSRLRLIIIAFLIAGNSYGAQSPVSNKKLMEQAQAEFAAGKFAEAERDLGELAKREPANIQFQAYLGHSLFRQQKYAASIIPYEKARSLEASGSKLTLEEHRVLLDQLVMAYGISGDLKKAHDLLDDGISKDPDYPLNYYNLACAFAEEGKKDKVLANLSLAFERKDHALKGEGMPDPRADSSFQKYLSDDDFIKLTKKLGYK